MVLLLLCGATAVEGQLRVGGELAFADDVDFGIGALVEVPLTSINENLEFGGRFDFFFPDGYDYWEINGDVRYLFPLPDNSQVVPYALAGLAIGRISADIDVDIPGVNVDASNTEVALRLGGGVKFPMERVTPFAELGLGIGDIPDFAIRGGLSLALGG
jgi:hypothetical protein